jgi:hypothetical protein
LLPFSLFSLFLWCAFPSFSFFFFSVFLFGSPFTSFLSFPFFSFFSFFFFFSFSFFFFFLFFLLFCCFVVLLFCCFVVLVGLPSLRVFSAKINQQNDPKKRKKKNVRDLRFDDPRRGRDHVRRDLPHVAHELGVVGSSAVVVDGVLVFSRDADSAWVWVRRKAKQ